METLRQSAAEAVERFAARPPEPAWQIEHERAEIERARLALEAKSRRVDLAAHRQAELLVGMSDDLRTPLDSVLILAKLLADNEGNNLTAQQVDFAQTIYAAGTDLLSLVDDILDLARLESNRTLDVTEHPFRELRIYLLRAFRQAARERHAAFDVVLAEGLPEAIRTDGKRLRHLLKSLLSMAFKSAHGGRVVLSVASHGNDAVFEVVRRAEGGIDCEQAAGLSLSICGELAHSLGGDVRAFSLKGDAIHLALHLPLVFQPEDSTASLPIVMKAPEAMLAGPERDVVAAPETPPAAYLGRKSRCADEAVMLIVEGNAQVASVMLDLVRANGYQGVVATDLGTLRVLLREVLPEAILIGGSLMDIDGWTTLELLKRDPATRTVPISMSYFDTRKYLCVQVGPRAEWLPGGAQRLLAEIDAAAGRRAGRLLMAGVPESAQSGEFLRCADGREVRRVASAAEALDAFRRHGADAVVVGRSLGDMGAVEFVRTLGTAEPNAADLPVVIVEGADGASPASLEIAMLRHRARLEDTLGETAMYLAQSIGNRPPPSRDAALRRRDVSPELAGRRALIVDDDIYNVYAMTGALEQQGMTVVLAESAKEGLEALRNDADIDVVLIDITMPEIDGDSVVHAMRSTHERPLPIIAVTPHAMPGDREKCIGAGASDYISKPVNVEQMLALLRTWLARGR